MVCAMKKAGVFSILFVVMLLAGAVMAEAQQPAKIPRIGYLSAASLSTSPARIEAFLQGLRDLGYVEGKNIVIEYRFAEGKFDRLPALVAELVRLKVDLIVVTGVGDLRSAKEATATIPIVMVVEVVSSPVWRKTPDASRMPDVPRPRPPALTTAASL